ncbi:RSM10 [Candida oxycetoniae]|uniref:RSM10 n=1 Tax=Candida oxycetoniae TaxID=497107 RepID=A0AAI9WWC6_9ASCO|nr:RSM10 [Candida oxycetoniae]KAI3402887.2 RSM10 [Candida oxycetoniae]
MPSVTMRGLSMLYLRVSKRTFSSQSLKSQKFLTPKKLIEKSQKEYLEKEQFHQQLLNDQIKYEPKTLSSHSLRAASNSKRPVPLNVELLKYVPLRLPRTHGDEVCTLTLRGYDNDDLTRIGEFALRAAYYLGIPMSNLLNLKTEKRLYTVIKSPFAQAKTKQNFHRTTYNKKVVAYDANPEIVDLWLSYVNKYNFQNVELKATISSYEGLDYSEQIAQVENLELPSAYEGIEDPVALKVKELLQSEEFKNHL